MGRPHVRQEGRRWLRALCWVMDLALQVVVVLLVLLAVGDRWGAEAAIAAGLLLPVTYLLGPMLLGIVAGTWLAFGLQILALAGAVGLLGVPRIDRQQETGRGCLQVLAAGTLLVLVDLALHLAALALVIGQVERGWGRDGAMLAAVAFPLTYVLGPAWMAYSGAGWLPLILQAAAFALLGLVVVMADN
jgi:hypothetical protein